jgi:quinol monooxygenase YgiN
MTTFLIRHQVTDFDTWHQGYLAAADIQQQGGVTDKAVYRDADDPNLVLVMHTFASREQGEAMMGSPDLHAAQQAAGVDMATVRVEIYDPA